MIKARVMNTTKLYIIPATALMLAMHATVLPAAAQQTGTQQGEITNKAKTFSVKGNVTDSLTHEPEMYATMKITRAAAPDDNISMSTTDKNGRFSAKLKSPGEYTLTIYAVGRKPIVRNFTLSNDNASADLGTLLITDMPKELKGVEIVAQKPLVKADIDKIEYNIEEDPDSKTSNTLEMLRKVPMVTVDGNETIKVNGSSSFKVYVNGRPNNMMSNNPKEVLKSMPASSIKRIEVITNPGPKYDAEGVGGILNIITVGKGLEGYTATANASVGRGQTSEGVYATVKQGKLTMSARYSYSYWDSFGSDTHTSRTFTGDTSTPSAYNSNGDSHSRDYSNSHSGSFEASYDIDTLRLVTASVGIWSGLTKGNESEQYNAVSPLDQAMLYRYANRQTNNNDNLYIDGSIDYQRMFKVKDRMLTLSYKINGGTQDCKSYLNYHDNSATDEWSDFMQRMRDQHYKGYGRSMEHTFQIDYTTPLAKAHTIDVGAKYILRDNRANNDRYTRQPGEDTDYTFDDKYSSHYRHQNDILAAYIGYGLKLGSFSGRIGARYEHTSQTVKYLLGEGENFKTSFNDIVPSASIGYKLSDEQSLRLGYNMRIWRPGIGVLNPYLDQSNPTALSQGNPNLVSEKNHRVSATYNYFAAKLSISFTLSYSLTNNNITSVTTLVADNTIESVKNPTGKMVSYTTYRNAGRSQMTSLTGYISWSIFKNTRLFMNLWGDYSDYDDRQTLHNYGWYGSIYAGLQQTLPKSWKINAGFNGWTSNPGLQSNSSGASFYNVSVQKSLLKDRLTINAYANNFFSKKRHSHTTTTGPNFITELNNSYNILNYGISVSYRIGNLSSGVKKAQKSIENDDVKGGGGKN